MFPASTIAALLNGSAEPAILIFPRADGETKCSSQSQGTFGVTTSLCSRCSSRSAERRSRLQTRSCQGRERQRRRHDRGHARARDPAPLGRIGLVAPDGDVADAYALDIGDRVARAGLELADHDAELARTRAPGSGGFPLTEGL